LQANFSPDANELQLTPSAPLAAGYYRLVLQGIGTLASPNTDTTINFRITGSEATTGDDIAATSHYLGDLGNGNLLQVAGAVGDDPFYSFYDPNNPNPSYPNFEFPNNYAGADVDLYHFTISRA